VASFTPFIYRKRGARIGTNHVTDPLTRTLQHARTLIINATSGKEHHALFFGFVNYRERRDQAFRRLEEEIHKLYKGRLLVKMCCLKQ
jgi:hypothetical protein